VIISKLGEGGMGSVYRALDRNIEADVVIKIPRQAMMEDPEFASRFTREIRSLVKLSHPHIVKVSDVGEWEGTPFAVMQFLPGGSLEDQRPTGPGGQPVPCDPKKVPRWLEAVAGALDYIHVQGYVHRDVKPGNILFDAEGHAFLSDFGVAKVLASSADKNPSQTAMTGTGMVLGTPEYMAPELIMGEPFDGRVDQYALAVTVYELLCGRRPFENETKTKILVLHTSSAPPRLTEWCPELPEPLSRAVLKGLSKDPLDRYPNCAALAAAVAAATAGVSARGERVRLKCPNCGKTGGMPAADYAKLKDAGRRPSCSACRIPLEVVATSPERAAPGGTTVVSHGGIPGDYGSSTEPGMVRGGTMAMSAPKSHGEKPTDPEPRPIASRPAPKTMIEDSAPPPDEKAAAVLLAVQERPLADDVLGTAGAHRKTAQAWVAVAAGAAAAVMVLTFVVMGLFPRNEAKPAAPAAGPQAADAGRPTQVLLPSSATRPEPKAPKLAEKLETKSTGPDVKTAGAAATQGAPPEWDRQPAEAAPTTSNSGLAAANLPDQQKRPDPQVASKIEIAAATSRDSKPPAIQVPRSRFDLSLLARKPTKAKHPLKKVVADARSYSNQIVIPTGMYHLERPRADRSGGPRKLWVTERTIESKRGNTLGMSSSASAEVEVEPGLAECIDKLDEDQLKDKMAIVSVWVASDGTCQLVKAEILQRYITGFKKGFVPRGDVDYETLVVTPQGSNLAKAEDADWEQPGRMLHFANAYKNRVLAFKNMLQANEQAKLQSVMGNMWGQMMRDAAAKEAQDRQLRQRLLPGSGG